MSTAKSAVLLLAYAATLAVSASVLAQAPAGADGAVGNLHRPVGNDLGGAVLSQINAVRAANGCGPVAPNPQLVGSAARQAVDMLTNGVRGHTGSDGSSLDQRVTAAGYTSYTKLGEIMFSITGPGGTPAAAVSSWMTSPGHRAIITDCGLTEAGFAALANGDKIAVVGDFGTR